MTAFNIRNLTAKPLWLRLNSGDHIRLSPQELSDDIPATMLEGNDQAMKLAEGGIIRVTAIAENPEKRPAVGPAHAEGAEHDPKKRKRD